MSSKFETGILRALKAYKVEKGLSDSAATAWANVNLSAGIALYKTELAKHRNSEEESSHKAAFSVLKAWAQS